MGPAILHNPWLHRWAASLQDSHMMLDAMPSILYDSRAMVRCRGNIVAADTSVTIKFVVRDPGR